MINKFNNPLRVFGWSIVLLTFAFLINNILNFWYDFPGVDKFFGNYNIFYENNNKLNLIEYYKSWIQFLIYIIAIFISFVYVKLYNQVEINKESNVTLRIYDIAGKKIYEQKVDNMLPGVYDSNSPLVWEAHNFSSGIYVYSIELSTGEIDFNKLMLIK